MMFVSSNSNTTAVTEFTPGFQWDRVRARIYILYKSLVRVMVFNATLNNISVILWQSVLLLEEIGENHQKQDISASLKKSVKSAPHFLSNINWVKVILNCSFLS